MIADDTAHEAGHESGTQWPDAISWRSASVCRKHPTRWWFAGSHRETVMAKGICSGCAVREPCLEFAMSRPELLGVWAATTPVERATLRRRRLEPQDPSEPAVTGERSPSAPVAFAEGLVEHAGAGFQAPAPVAPALIDLVRAEREHQPEPRKRGGSRGPGRVEIPLERDELLTPAEAARKLGVTPNTVTRWSRAGKISAIQTMGGHRRFRLAEIERVLRDGSAAFG